MRNKLEDRLNAVWWWYNRHVYWPLKEFRVMFAIWIAGDAAIVGFMDKVDAECELGAALGGNKVHPSIEDVRKHHPCVKQCGIRRVHILLGKVEQDENFWDDED